MFVRAKNGIDSMTISDFNVESNEGADMKSKNKKMEGSVACEGFIATYHEYCENTSIHGVQYLGERERPMRERIFWLFVFLISIYGCSTLILSAYTKWTETVGTCGLVKNSYAN